MGDNYLARIFWQSSPEISRKNQRQNPGYPFWPDEKINNTEWPWVSAPGVEQGDSDLIKIAEGAKFRTLPPPSAPKRPPGPADEPAPQRAGVGGQGGPGDRGCAQGPGRTLYCFHLICFVRRRFFRGSIFSFPISADGWFFCAIMYGSILRKNANKGHFIWALNEAPSCCHVSPPAGADCTSRRAHHSLQLRTATPRQGLCPP